MPKSVDISHDAHQVISDFHDIVRKYYQFSSGNGYAYTSGYLGSILASLVADLPKTRRQRVIDQLTQQIKEFEDKYLIECLSSNDKV